VRPTDGSTDTNPADALVSFCGPTGITIDTAGNLYVADAVNGTIRKITPAQVVRTVAGTTGSNVSGPYPVALPGTINIPLSVTMFSTNQLVIGTMAGDLLGANFHLAEVVFPFASFSPSLALLTSPPTKLAFGSTLKHSHTGHQWPGI
jgi:hypothetical protein